MAISNANNVMGVHEVQEVLNSTMYYANAMQRQIRDWGELNNWDELFKRCPEPEVLFQRVAYTVDHLEATYREFSDIMFELAQSGADIDDGLEDLWYLIGEFVATMDRLTKLMNMLGLHDDMRNELWENFWAMNGGVHSYGPQSEQLLLELCVKDMRTHCKINEVVRREVQEALGFDEWQLKDAFRKLGHLHNIEYDK